MEQSGTKTTKKSWVRHTKLAFRKRWVQVCIVLFFWLVAMVATATAFAPKPIPKGDTSQFLFMHCDNCQMELTLRQETA